MRRVLVLVTVVIALIGIIAVELVPLAPTMADPTPMGLVSDGLSRNTIEAATDMLAATWVATALDRPLFREDRRAVKVATGATRTLGTARLTGVMTGPFGNRAIFTSSGENKPFVASEGGRVSDFVIRSIGPGQAVVEIEGNIRTLRPSFAGDGAPSSQ